MTLWKEWTNRLRYLRGRMRIDSDLEHEIRFHLESRIDELEASGLSRDDARRQAHGEFGSVNLARDDSRAAWQFRCQANLVRAGLERQGRHQPQGARSGASTSRRGCDGDAS